MAEIRRCPGCNGPLISGLAIHGCCSLACADRYLNVCSICRLPDRGKVANFGIVLRLGPAGIAAARAAINLDIGAICPGCELVMRGAAPDELVVELTEGLRHAMTGTTFRAR
jgi:hypothetical protein